MGFLKNLFGKSNGTANGSTQQYTHQQVSGVGTSGSGAGNGVSLRKEEAVAQLNLRKETLGVSLRKNNMENVFARVAVVMDCSGSMTTLFQNGTVQSIIERLLPIGLKFDDNGELDIWLFSNMCQRMKGMTEGDFYGYVDREIFGSPRINRYLWGGTDYAPVINDVVLKYAKEEPSDVPTFVIFITDGENTDRKEAKKAIVEASKHNIFWQFVGIGDEDFRFLQKLDEMEGRVIDNANFFQIEDINRISDEQLYDKLLTEYPSWERQIKSR